MSVIERKPKHCPFCGGKKIDTDLVEWPAYSSDDEDNRVTLNENQCIECAGASFWT